MTAKVNLAAGTRFGKLTVIGMAPAKSQKSMANVLCDCGQMKVIRTGSLLSGNTSSCGCWTRPGTHGQTRGGPTRTYRIWCNMRARCSGQISPENYAARGIGVCDRWLSFENFLADMGEAPEGHSLERRDNDGNYEPGNCKWATLAEQARNRRNNVFVEHNGKSMCVADWCTAYGLYPATFHRRLKAGRLDTQQKGTQ